MNNDAHTNQDLPQAQPCFEHGHWYLRDSDYVLFIVPDDRHGISETSGPDDETLEQLNAAYRAVDQSVPDWFDTINREQIADDLGLSIVDGWQQRFDRELGYYTV